MKLFEEGHLTKEELEALKDVFHDTMLEVIGDFDPQGLIIDEIKHENSMGFKNYLIGKTNDFIEYLRGK